MTHIYKKSTALIAGAALSLSLIQPGEAAVESNTYQTFTDVDRSSEFYDSIESMYYKGVMSGYQTGSNFLDPKEMKPLQPVTRAQASKMMVNAAGMFPATQNTNSFEDVPESHWADTYVTLLSRADVISGKEDGSFDPEGQLNRAQVAKMIAETFDLPLNDGETSFEDVPEDSWFAPYVNALLDSGITTGRTEDSFDPYGTVTRYQLAAFLDRALDQLTVDEMNDRQTLMIARETLVKLNDQLSYQRKNADSTEDLPGYDTFSESVTPFVTDDYEPTLIERYENVCVNCGATLFHAPFFPEKYIDFDVKNEDAISFTVAQFDSPYLMEVDLLRNGEQWQVNGYIPDGEDTPPAPVDFEQAANFVQYLYEGGAYDRITYLDERPDAYRFYHEKNGLETIFVVNKNTGAITIEP
ncbi:S-layer homology domain-containing protein [Jeotgalibacillus terrae]|uniref:S-layer homology domain-containing protein n=1 Tax=Jeotgalibacillus terrae TaxID=587735 RepID=A0ABW5ZDH5_9BACL|nr:S-layer homology domain-containing protein [Jeotgalibacillus terrae]MBM7577899.1 hypothetical protein [Jeotgalibacillus terrae]